jgi:hypothetical protein
MKVFSLIIILFTLALSREISYTEKKLSGGYLLSFDKISGVINLRKEAHIGKKNEFSKRISLGVPISDVMLTKNTMDLVVALKEINRLVIFPLSHQIQEVKNFSQLVAKRNSFKESKIEIHLDGVPLCLKEYEGKIFVFTNKNLVNVVDLRTKEVSLNKNMALPLTFGPCSISKSSEIKSKLIENLQTINKTQSIDNDLPVEKPQDKSIDLSPHPFSNKRKNHNTLNNTNSNNTNSSLSGYNPHNSTVSGIEEGMSNIQIGVIIIVALLSLACVIFGISVCGFKQFCEWCRICNKCLR